MKWPLPLAVWLVYGSLAAAQQASKSYVRFFNDSAKYTQLVRFLFARQAKRKAHACAKAMFQQLSRYKIVPLAFLDEHIRTSDGWNTCHTRLFAFAYHADLGLESVG
jgi:hypothetical protein